MARNFSYLSARGVRPPIPKEASHVCEFDFDPLEATTTTDLIKHSISGS